MNDRSFRPRLTALEEREVLSTTNLFDAGWYLAHNPDVAAAVQRGLTTAEDHFRRFGDAERRAGNPLFDDKAYLDDNRDVRDAVERGAITAFRHFELFGQFEGRNPSHAFNTRDYLDDNPDVRAAVQQGQASAFEHFLRHGEFEDRLPFHGFDRRAYLDDNPDVRDAVQRGLITAVAHFEIFGQHEGRRLATATPITLSVGQTATVTGVSQNHDDKKFFSFTPPQSGTLRVVVETTNGTFAQVEIENARTSVQVFETDPNDGVNTGSVAVTGGTPYLLRVRAPRKDPAQFTVRLTLS
jgi:hypothetical protein